MYLRSVGKQVGTMRVKLDHQAHAPKYHQMPWDDFKRISSGSDPDYANKQPWL